ncbi:hypothetical protein [Saccharothrix sp. NRRL B-16348]|nr:hypothetical protein [Saccharothrix sp. NRRL B-16348]
MVAAVVLLFAVAGCRADGATPADPGLDGIEATLDSVEAEVAEP